MEKLPRGRVLRTCELLSKVRMGAARVRAEAFPSTEPIWTYETPAIGNEQNYHVL